MAHPPTPINQAARNIVAAWSAQTTTNLETGEHGQDMPEESAENLLLFSKLLHL
jgi:hypothetical protein